MEELEELWNEVVRQLSERDYAENWVHGIPHVKRVWGNLKFLLKSCSLSKNMVRCLKVAVLVHDAGRGLPGDHAENSAEIFGGMEMNSLTKEESENIFFAVKNHSKGLAGVGVDKAEGNKDVLLGLLVLLDHMDALGRVDFYRTIQWSKDTGRNLDLLSRLNPQELRKFIGENYLSQEIEEMNLKEESILTHLIFNYLVADQIVTPVSHLLSDEFLLEINHKKAELLDEVNKMIDLMEENQIKTLI